MGFAIASIVAHNANFAVIIVCDPRCATFGVPTAVRPRPNRHAGHGIGNDREGSFTAGRECETNFTLGEGRVPFAGEGTGWPESSGRRVPWRRFGQMRGTHRARSAHGRRRPPHADVVHNPGTPGRTGPEFRPRSRPAGARIDLPDAPVRPRLGPLRSDTNATPAGYHSRSTQCAWGHRVSRRCG